MAKGKGDAFSDLLDRTAGEAERPKALPAGHYTCLVVEQKFGVAQNEAKTPLCTYLLQPQSPGDDVDTDELEDISNWQRRRFKGDFFLDEDSIWRLDDFLAKCGVNMQGRSYKEVIPEAKNCEVQAFVIKEPSKQEGDDTDYNRVRGYLAV